MIKIILVDDNTDRVKSIENFCGEKYTIIQKFEYADEARQWIKTDWKGISANDQPDVMIIDLRLRSAKGKQIDSKSSRNVLFALAAKEIPCFPAILISEDYNEPVTHGHLMTFAWYQNLHLTANPYYIDNDDWLNDLATALNNADAIRRNQTAPAGADLLRDWFQVITAHSKAANGDALESHVTERIIALSEHYGLKGHEALTAQKTAQGQVAPSVLEFLTAELTQKIKASETFKNVNAKFRLA